MTAAHFLDPLAVGRETNRAVMMPHQIARGFKERCGCAIVTLLTQRMDIATP